MGNKRLHTKSLSKGWLAAGSLFSFLMILHIVLYTFFGIRLFEVPAYIEYKVVGSTQIQKQMKEAEERSLSPPTPDELQQMESNGNICFHNDDCRLNAERLVDCNGPIQNKYFCSKKYKDGEILIQCASTLMGCSDDKYFVCEQNQCQRKKLNLHIKSKFSSF